MDDTSKLTTLFKKYQGYVNTGNLVPVGSEFPRLATQYIFRDRVLKQQIPSVAPTTTSGTPPIRVGSKRIGVSPYTYIVNYIDTDLISVPQNPDKAFVYSLDQSENLLRNAIPTNYDSLGSYQATVFAQTSPGIWTLLPQQQYTFDRDVGVVTLFNYPTITSTNPPRVSFWRYEGEIGVDAVGPTGPTGGTGYTGDTGPQGPIGFQGAQGMQGVQGLQGPQGVHGPQGFQGIDGPQGFQSQQGHQGSQGSQGPQGFDGVQGVQGTQGAQGSQGFQGTHGTQGWQGTQGLEGSQGTQGEQGNQGAQGWQGNDGPQGFQGWQGVNGQQGFQGLQGSQGFQGLLGPQGWQGFQGLGPQGPQGAQGPQGFQGFFGIQGPQGPTGIIGFQGLMGRQGNIGPQGNQGPRGNQGPQGFNGTQGVSALYPSSLSLTVDSTIFIIPNIEDGAPLYDIIFTNVDDSGNSMQTVTDFLAAQINAGTPGPLVISSIANPSNICYFRFGSAYGTVAFPLSGPTIPPYPIWLISRVQLLYGPGYPTIPFTSGTKVAVFFAFDGNTGTQGYQGPSNEGPTGPQGFQGPQAVEGTQGPQGDAGIQGPMGFQGPQGNAGLQGPQGDASPQGPQGPQGLVGPDIGSQGPQGPKGPLGNQGPVGSDVGSQGPQGALGAQGLIGAVAFPASCILYGSSSAVQTEQTILLNSISTNSPSIFYISGGNTLNLDMSGNYAVYVQGIISGNTTPTTGSNVYIKVFINGSLKTTGYTYLRTADFTYYLAYGKISQLASFSTTSSTNTLTVSGYYLDNANNANTASIQIAVTVMRL